MTYAEEFVPEEQEAAPAGPLGLSPTVLGAIIGVLGAIGAGVIVWKLILPTNQQNATLSTEIADLEAQITQQQAKLGTIGEAQAKLNEVEFQRQELLSFFATDEALDISLLDLERLVLAQRLNLKAFAPEGDIEVVMDSSLGAAVNGRFKRQKYTMTVEGEFAKTQAFFRSLEKYEPIIQVVDFTVESQPPIQVFQVLPNKKLSFTPKETKVTTKLNLQVVVLRSQEELDEEKAAAEAAAAAAAAPPPEAAPAEAPPP